MTKIIDVLYRNQTSTPIWDEIDKFALALLMPEEDVKNFVSKNNSLNKFCETFQVMPEHARKRLKQLGYKLKKIIDENN